MMLKKKKIVCRKGNWLAHFKTGESLAVWTVRCEPFQTALTPWYFHMVTGKTELHGSETLDLKHMANLGDGNYSSSWTNRFVLHVAGARWETTAAVGQQGNEDCAFPCSLQHLRRCSTLVQNFYARLQVRPNKLGLGIGIKTSLFGNMDTQPYLLHPPPNSSMTTGYSTTQARKFRSYEQNYLLARQKIQAGKYTIAPFLFWQFCESSNKF